VTVGILVQHRELVEGKDAIEIHGLPGRACAFELVAKFWQRHPLHRFPHGSDHSGPDQLPLPEVDEGQPQLVLGSGGLVCRATG